MARAVLRLEGTELNCFHSNYIYMWKKLNTAPYYVSGFGEYPSWIRGAELLPSYVNLSKCMNADYVPSVNLVNKIVHFYNANISPSIDTYAFLHEILENSDSCRTALVCASQQPYCGEYYGYYYSDTDTGHYIRGALIRIFEADGELHARLIYDLTADEDLQNPQLRAMLETDSIAENFSKYKKSLPLSKSLMALYTGSGKISPGVMALHMKRTDGDGMYMSLYLPTDLKRNEEYIGALGTAFLVTQDRAFQIFRAGFEKAEYKGLTALSLGDNRLEELLSFRTGSNERITMSPADNSAWVNYMILREQ